MRQIPLQSLKVPVSILGMEFAIDVYRPYELEPVIVLVGIPAASIEEAIGKAVADARQRFGPGTYDGLCHHAAAFAKDAQDRFLAA